MAAPGCKKRPPTRWNALAARWGMPTGSSSMRPRFAWRRGQPRPGLYWETIEQVLPGKKKFITDSSKARRQLFLIEDGVEIGGPALNPVFSETPRKTPGN